MTNRSTKTEDVSQARRSSQRTGSIKKESKAAKAKKVRSKVRRSERKNGRSIILDGESEQVCRYAMGLLIVGLNIRGSSWVAMAGCSAPTVTIQPCSLQDSCNYDEPRVSPILLYIHFVMYTEKAESSRFTRRKSKTQFTRVVGADKLKVPMMYTYLIHPKAFLQTQL